MIAGIEGILKARGDDWAIVAVGGVSFSVKVPAPTASLGDIGDRVQLHTYLQVREDNLSLFGFATAGQLSLFEMLISVSGIGPRTALALLSAFDPERLSHAIVTENMELIGSVPGVGKKTAARIVLELKAKLGKGGMTFPAVQQEVVAALLGLGYSAAEASHAISSMPDTPGISLEDKIKLALQHLARPG